MTVVMVTLVTVVDTTFLVLSYPPPVYFWSACPTVVEKYVPPSNVNGKVLSGFPKTTAVWAPKPAFTVSISLERLFYFFLKYIK